jgi:dTDP-4-dehydrorhamnose reductase
MTKVLVTGSNGQLGQSIRKIAIDYPELNFIFTDRSELDITNLEQSKVVFSKLQPDYCINCAAYTAVDKAEAEPEKAFLINSSGARNIAIACKANNTVLIHISTDFVFDGKKGFPYVETDEPNPINVYGKSKLEGEREIQNIWPKHFIIRTSWLYSEFGHNFVKTILRLSKERDEISVVDDQIGSPTYTRDLAQMTAKIICFQKNEYGVFHFCNEGNTTWHAFAEKIFKVLGIGVIVKGISSIEFGAKALRPRFSVLECKKMKQEYKITINQWENVLEECLLEISSKD